jgi:hypothetical protein
MLHQEIDGSALFATAEALVAIAGWVHLERSHRLVIVKWAQGFVANALFSQSVGVVAPVGAKTFFNNIFDVGTVQNLIDFIFLDLSHDS